MQKSNLVTHCEIAPWGKPKDLDNEKLALVQIGVWDEIIFPFSNLNGCTVEVWRWISNFIPLIIMDLTHCGLVTPYGNKDLGQHWLK